MTKAKPYPLPTVTGEPSPACKRMLDTNVLIDALHEDQLRYGRVEPWLFRLLENAPEGRILICDAVMDEFVHVLQNTPLGGGGQKATAQQAVNLLNRILRYRSVRVVPNASPPPGRFHGALLQMRAAPQRHYRLADCVYGGATRRRALLRRCKRFRRH